jgi:hypothetical protein
VSAAGAVVLQVPGGEQHERDRDHVAVPARDELVDAGVDQRLGQLDEPEADGQVRRRLAHMLGERPELLEAVGVAAAVADDEQRRAHAHPHAVAHHASAGTDRAPTHASGDAAGARSSAGIRPS